MKGLATGTQEECHVRRHGEGQPSTSQGARPGLNSPSQPSERTNQADTLILGFSPPGLRDNKFLLSEPLFVVQPQETDKEAHSKLEPKERPRLTEDSAGKETTNPFKFSFFLTQTVKGRVAQGASSLWP